MNTNSRSLSGLTESLPFVIRCVRDEAELAKAVTIRRSAYGRHVPELATRFASPEESDLDGSSRVLVALSKLDGMPLGSMRYRTNEARPLDVEQSVALPERLRAMLLTEATRLAVSQAAVGRVVKAMLLKAMFLQCEAGGIDCIVAAARTPMDRFYQWLYFEDVFPGGEFIPMAHAGMIPHRVMVCDIVATKHRWKEVNHPWYPLFFDIHHPDIELTPFPVVEPVARRDREPSSRAELRQRR
ncbi:MAG: hypothetical protein HZB40_05110 [Rhodocyclales bacterium]|nr:hypothetical protein [Rhodocyclales bacterium]